jgi:hypothetical protein
MFDCGCEIEAMIVNFKNNVGFLHTADGQFPSIEKTVRSFLAINQNIKRIETYVCNRPEEVLLYIPGLNKWNAFPPTEKFFGEIK